jgi:hypothetical protein
MKTCEAFVGQGVAVELIVPIRKNYLRQDPFDFYKVKRNFTITKISCVDALTWSFFKSLGFWIQTISYYFRAFCTGCCASDCGAVYGCAICWTGANRERRPDEIAPLC